MSLTDKMLKMAGKEGLELDERISKGYVRSLCWKYGWMMIRGKFFACGKKAIDSSVFVGRKVKVKEKRYLTIGAKTKLHDGVFIDALSKEGVNIGDHVVIGRNTRIECTGSLEYVGKGVKIGSRTTFNNDCFFGAAGGIDIGEDVVAGQFVRFHSENHNFDDLNKLIKEQGVSHKGIKIGNNCWIGSGAVFLDGVELEDGCVVGANSVIAGVPAKIIRTRGSNE